MTTTDTKELLDRVIAPRAVLLNIFAAAEAADWAETERGLESLSMHTYDVREALEALQEAP
jgi:hypothetical protein